MKKLVIIIIALAFLLSGCNSFQVESIFKTRDLVIDGNDKDWSDAKYYVKKHDVVFGVMNDNDYLYLCFYPTTSELTRQVLTQGLTLWINSEGKKKKEYGIRFPVRMQDLMKVQSGGSNEQQRFRQGKDDTGFNPNTMKQMVKSVPRILEIIEPEKDSVRVIDLDKLKGIEIKFEFEKDLFTYEMKIPLEENPDFSAYIGTDSTSKIAIDFEIPKPDMNAEEEKLKETREMGDLPEKGSSGGGRHGGGRGNESNEEGAKQPSVKKLEFWTTIQLVEN